MRQRCQLEHFEEGFQDFFWCDGIPSTAQDTAYIPVKLVGLSYTHWKRDNPKLIEHSRQIGALAALSRVYAVISTPQLDQLTRGSQASSNLITAWSSG
ncbi:uncharacterized protein PHALS_00778 [Plasmopara halstedii]|uniref:Uncharacterized protein n=1 Tax=Plasmopara halstedii TaxID=4781 RepID=A0A0P1AS44_PLAHL|nr:uncharacterized protein PHALS_00778 [Plasmopara halstedii]CEG44410.1 hypothetical protein PHALS_00778 [Plasmopara halstedii]|eukprot:XP_024580779.1 hypothetical protein PHALS_00778 [Plasmopara halstedii]